MAIGERINFFRKLRGMTQRHLGMLMGFPERSSDVRIAQYESGARTPKKAVVEELAFHLDVVSEALDVPNIETDLGMMHTLFTLEDLKGFTADIIDGEVVLRVVKDSNNIPKYLSMINLLKPWAELSIKYRNGEITKEEYDDWRYKYPKFAGLPWIWSNPIDVRDLPY